MKYLFISCVLFLPLTVLAAKSGTEIITHGENVMRGKSTQTLMMMSIHRPEFTRELKLRSWTSGSKKTFVEILKPSKETGVSSLRLENDMWNYLPKTDQVVRVPTSLMLQSWMGSDFTNDDLMKLSSIATDYTHKVQKTVKVGKVETVLIECVPKPGAPVVWGKILYWARTEDDLPVKEEYYDEKSTLIRTLELSNFKKMDDRVIPTQLIIRSQSNPNQYTEIKYEKILFDRKIDEGLFDRDSLRQNSQQGKNLDFGWTS